MSSATDLRNVLKIQQVVFDSFWFEQRKQVALDFNERASSFLDAFDLITDQRSYDSAWRAFDELEESFSDAVSANMVGYDE